MQLHELGLGIVLPKKCGVEVLSMTKFTIRTVQQQYFSEKRTVCI